MFSRRTKILAIIFLFAAILFVPGFREFRRHNQKIQAEWQGQERAVEYMELHPHLDPLARAAFFIATLSLVATFASGAVDIHRIRYRTKV